MKLIRELNTELLTESVLDETTGKKNWYISGITLQSDIQNKNKRTYPKKVLSEAIQKHVDEFLVEGRALGELNHPDNGISSINLDRVSHKFTSVTEDGNNYVTKAQVLNTPCGKIVQDLLEGGVKLGISSRGLGNIKQQDEGSLVENLYLVSLGDIVGDPSAPNAFVQGVLEGVEWEMKESGIIEKKVVEESLDKYSKLIKEATLGEINEAIKSIFSDYLEKLKI
jgi:hypothetical protein